VNKKFKAKVKTINRGAELWIEGIWTGSVAFLAGFAGLYFGSMGLFRMGIPIGFWSSALFILPALALCLVMQPGRFGGRIFGALVLTIAFCILLALPFHDLSWDGMAVRQVWVEDVLLRKLCPEALPSTHLLSAWLGLLGGSVDAGKAANPLLMICAFGFGLKAVTEAGFHGAARWLIALVAVLNPVSVYQLSSFYLDGAFVALLTCLGAAFWMVRLEAAKPFVWFSAGLCFLLMVTAKFSGLAYGVVLTGGLLLSLVGKRSVHFKTVVIGVLALIALGWLSHRLERKIAYNLALLTQSTDPNNRGFGVQSAPTNIQGRSKLEIFFLSHLSASALWPNEWKIKPPFWFTRPELAVFQDLNPDTRAGGFGPLYGTFLLFALAGVLVCPFWKKVPWRCWIPVATLMVSCLLSQSWWARWVPQAWLIPLCLALPIMAFFPKTTASRLSFVSVWVALLNSSLILGFYVAGCLENKQLLDGQIQFLKKLPQPIQIWVPDFPSNLTWLQQAGISHQKVDQKTAPPRLRLQRTTSQIALPKKWDAIPGGKPMTDLWRKRGLIED